MKNRAFTLIEILVVVLIIGILVAIAVPQYQKAVEKSRLSQMYVRLDAINKAAKIYEMANGSWPNDIRMLDIDVIKGAEEFKKDIWMTSDEHIAAFYDSKNSCGVVYTYRRVSFCRNQNLFLYYVNDELTCAGLNDIGVKLCESL